MVIKSNTERTTMSYIIPTPEEMDTLTESWKRHRNHNTEQVTVPLDDRTYQLLIVVSPNALNWCHTCEVHFTT